MIAFLSPAKKMKEARRPDLAATRPRFEDRTEALVNIMRGLSPWQMESALKINPEIALRAFSCYQNFASSAESAALLSYDGLAYRSLGACDFSAEDFAFAKTRLRVFSALYGPLRPADAIKPYRLELARRLPAQDRGGGERSLYRFWGDTFYRDVFSDGGPAVNLASGEYAKAVSAYLRPGDRMITCSFLVRRRGRAVCLPTYAKMARGRMARFIILSRADRPEALREFREDGFRYSIPLSTDDHYVFMQE